MSAVGGTITVRVNGKQLKARGSWTYNRGDPKREMIVGADGPHGHKEMPQVAFIEGEYTKDSANFPVAELNNIVGATVTIELADGDVFTLRDAVQTSEGTLNTEEGNGSVRFEGMSADFV